MASEPQNPSLEPLSLSETTKEEEGSVSKKQLKKLAKEAEKKKAKEAHKTAERQQQKAASATGGSESSEEDPFSANYGDVPLEELQSKYSSSGRVWTEVKDLNAEMKDKTVLIRGSAQAIRTLSKTAFIIIRQSKSNVQCVFSKDSLSAQMVKFAKDLSIESFVEVEGVVSVPNEAIKGTTQQVEIQGRKLYCINRAANLPFKIEDAARSEAEYEEAEQKGKQLVRVLQDTRLNYRVLDICTPANDAIFEIQFQVEEMFRQYLKLQGFRGIHSPKIIPGSSEGGAAVFKLDYMGQPACLAQSPQLYKQMVVKKFRKVFEVGPVFRAEKSYTHRHLCEFTGLDVEMEIKEHYFEVCDVVDKLFVAIFEHLNKNCTEDLKAIKEQYPFEDLKYLPKTLKLNYEEGIQMLKESGVEIDPMGDLNTESEKKLGQLVREKYNTDFYILCRYPSGVRPFYTMPCYDDKNFSNSFDVFIRGEEIISGAQRIHEPELLTHRATECGIDVKTISNYIDSFRYGPPPHGGFGVGLERVVMLFCNLNNIRKTSLFPRDPQRLSP